VATAIVNASADGTSSPVAAQSVPAGGPALRFRWPSQVYLKSWECHTSPSRPHSGPNTTTTAAATASPPPGAPEVDRAALSNTSNCGYKYTDLASHPLAVLLPYSVHSYGVVQAYALGVPFLAPSPRLLARWHIRFGFVNHRGPGNVPWRRSKEQKRVPNDGFAWLTHNSRLWWTPPPQPGRRQPGGRADGLADANGCAADPNDACDEDAAHAWLQFSEPYAWPHVTLFDSIPQLIGLARHLMANATRRKEISDGMKAFVQAEHHRAMSHAQAGLLRAMRAVQEQRSGSSQRAADTGS